MKEIVVVSDTHYNNEPLKEIVRRFPSAIAYLHLGDSQVSEAELFPFVSVKGNNDYLIEKEERLLTIRGFVVYMTHGHKMYLSQENMLFKAKQKQCDIFLFGHTHRPFYEVIDGIHFINPGSASLSRSAVGNTFAVITLLDDGKIDVSFETI